MALPNELFVGPSGWQRPDWIATVYPKPASRGWHALDLLLQYANLAEIDQTFLAPLKPEIARLYVKKVERHRTFLFTALLGRQFTYERNLSAPLVAAWKAGMAPILQSGRLGAVVMQFPWAFRYTEENRQFLIQLRREFHEFPLSAELRHESWLRDEAVTTLVNYHVGFVNVDQPRCFRATPPTALLTTSVAVVRLHGRSNAEAFRDGEGTPDADYLYDLDELLEWKPRLERLAANAARTLVVVANAARGQAMVNALQIQQMLGGGNLQAPEALLSQYPSKLAAFRARRPVQTLLLPAQAA